MKMVSGKEVSLVPNRSKALKNGFLCFGAKNAQNQVFGWYGCFAFSVMNYAAKSIVFFGAKYRQNQLFAELGLIRQHREVIFKPD